jgi:DsbC/DsbD-like thiol-disulfide interchange protein
MDTMWKFSVATVALSAGVILGAQAPGAESSRAPAASKETAHLKITTTQGGEAVRGRKVSLFIDVAPKPKMHVYAPGQAGYIAINLTLDPNPAFTAAKAKYPAGEKLLIKILNETQIVYAKPFRIAQEVTLAPTRARSSADGAPLTINGMLRYQACDDTICYLPVNIPVAWTVKLAAAQ